MLGTINLFIVGAIATTLGSGAAPLVLHAMFGPNLPPQVQALAELFIAVFKTGSAVFLGPAQLVRRLRISIASVPPATPPSDIPESP